MEQIKNPEATMREDGKLDYLEMRGGDLPAVKAFYGRAFGWSFVDYGPEYAAFNEGLDGGFYANTADAVPAPAPLPVLYAKDLEAMLEKVKAAGAIITKPIFEFPGGRRFHFRDPAGNELAVWSER
jgi:predicted enzyme related to lactoylglutathione lyase